ncbi:polysaccharide deacetylase family protein [Danxiaibacter flavus]|uniref:Polysaccharide deacetylase family protein n=1 Tax=Danxiaibacter flavus TaxID=3049108 RepID=A0ABV3ZKW6_9BACT|nr:polysaccharide deacetylase family protein [Chitinophagaceae bacterium DXS]
MKQLNRFTLLTFDVEEFDLPLEYGCAISVLEQMDTGYDGLKKLQQVLHIYNQAYTFFTTANFASQYPDEIRRLSESNEIGSHTFFHSSFEERHLLESRITLENITGKKVIGLRMPRLQAVSPELVQQAGYIYNSSINPSWLPGRYNNLSKPRTLYKQLGVVNVPVSVSSNFRIPLFWLAFKNLPYAIYKKMAIHTLKKDGYLSLYFHPWEFTEITQYNIPFYIKRHSGTCMQERLHQLIKDLKKDSDFICMRDLPGVQCTH